MERKLNENNLTDFSKNNVSVICPTILSAVSLMNKGLSYPWYFFQISIASWVVLLFPNWNLAISSVVLTVKNNMKVIKEAQEQMKAVQEKIASGELKVKTDSDTDEDASSDREVDVSMF